MGGFGLAISWLRAKTMQALGRRHAEEFSRAATRQWFPLSRTPSSDVSLNPPGLLRLEPHAEGLRDRIWWGAASNATSAWAAKLEMNLQSSTLKFPTRPVSRFTSSKPRRFAPFKQPGRRLATPCTSAHFGQPQYLCLDRRSGSCLISDEEFRSRTRS